MPDWIKWIIAPKEMAELDRWRVEWNEHRRWLAEFKTVGMALDNLRTKAEGKPAVFISDLREKMRSGLKKQNAALSLINELADTEISEIACEWSMAPVEDILGRMFDLIGR